ncbi:hypothetical protein ONZ45_g6423 [Pleurotus djamor]|nr:hypothetical protein ONZ45_g6423 [Pleurotus djamor]
MAILLPYDANPAKRCRRTATAVMGGAFDIRPPRDVLTSLLNGVGPYKVVEKDDELRRNKRRDKKERDRERKRQKVAAAGRERASTDRALGTPDAQVASSSTSTILVAPPPLAASTSSFWRARPAIHIPALPRSMSVTPPPSFPIHTPSTPESTPGPSDSSSTSRTSSKRPRTPDDFEDLDMDQVMRSSSPPTPKLRKKRVAAKKGWKGWVEGSPPPSGKLINLDAVPILQERRTRSGKNFDAIGVGKEGWV